MLQILLRMSEGAFRARVNGMITDSESMAKQLWGWSEHVKNSGIEGPKHLTEKQKVRIALDRDRAELSKEIARLADESRRSRYGDA